jgi:hypothetical protein
MSADTKDKPRKRYKRNQDAPANGAGKKGVKKVELAAQVAAELDTLRTALDEMTEHYRLRLGAQITELLQTVREEQGSEQKPRIPPARTLLPMLEQLKSARLKPGKGRAKDFVRLQQLLDEVTELTPPE